MNNARINAIRDRLAAVPHRHGEVNRYDDSDGSINYQLTIGVGRDSLIWDLADDRDGRAAKATAELLAHAPEDIAALVHEVDRLERERDRLYDQLQVLDSRCNNAASEVLHLKRCVAERDEDLARRRVADLALRATIEALAEQLRDDLWVGSDDQRGHAYYERFVDLVQGTPSEEG